mgnify:CR=1 FL=1
MFTDYDTTNKQLLLSLFGKLLQTHQNAQFGELATLLAVFYAVRTLHQTAHWQVGGRTSYSDHLLFERLYNDTASEVDDLAEKLIGLDSPICVDPLTLSFHSAIIIKNFCKSQTNIINSESIVMRALEAEQNLLSFIAIVIEALNGRGVLTIGLENLLADMHDSHERHIYLLKQRLDKVSNF